MLTGHKNAPIRPAPRRRKSCILAVLDEQLLIGIERGALGQEPERKVAPAPESMSAGQRLRPP
jgi:hypothetical protein